MKKIMVIGCPGSGKSTFSRALHKRTGIPLFHLDMLYWNKDKTTVEKHVFLKLLSEIFQKNEWIIDGNYASTLELRLKECDTVIFLDFPQDICINGIKERKGKAHSDIPWISNEEDNLKLIEFAKSYNLQCRPEIFELLDKYSHKNIYILKNRDEADKFLNQV